MDGEMCLRKMSASIFLLSTISWLVCGAAPPRRMDALGEGDKKSLPDLTSISLNQERQSKSSYKSSIIPVPDFLQNLLLRSSNHGDLNKIGIADQPTKSNLPKLQEIRNSSRASKLHKNQERKARESLENGEKGVSLLGDLEPEVNHNRSTITLDKEYTAKDIAIYIFWTGDEKGVTMAVNDLLNELWMSRDDAIKFLEDVNSNLAYLKYQYKLSMTSSTTQSSDFGVGGGSSMKMITQEESRREGPTTGINTDNKDFIQRTTFDGNGPTLPSS